MELRKKDSSKANLVSEARELVAKAEKKCRPSFNHWKPMYSAAGAAFCHAALLLHQAGDDEEAKLNLLKACDCFKKKRAWYSAAKTLEQAMAICIKQEDLSAMTELAWRSAALFRKAGQPDSAAQLLERASKSLENVEPLNSELMLEKAVETVETENRPIQAAWYVNKLLRLALKRRNAKQAVVKARKLVELYQEAGHKPSTGRSVLGLVLLLVNVNFFGEAELVAREFGNNCTKEQNIFIEDLLDAFDQNNADKLKKVISHKCLAVLDAEYKPILDSISLPSHLAHLGTRPRSRSRRHFNDISSGEEETKEKEEDCNSDDNKVGNDDEVRNEEGGCKPPSKVHENGHARSAPQRQVSSAERQVVAPTLPQKDESKDESSKPVESNWTIGSNSRLPSRRSGRNPLRKSLTTDEAGSHNKASLSGERYRQQKRNFDRQRSNHESGPTAAIDVGSDSLEQHRPAHLPSPTTYVDVEGVDPIQPAYLGMTVEQWRALKRQHKHDEADEAFDDEYLAGIGEEAVGDDFS